MLSGIMVENKSRAAVVNDWRHFMVDEQLFLSRPKRSKTKYGPGHPGLSQFNALFRYHNAKPINSFRFETQRALDGAVAISIGLDDRHVSNIRADELFGRLKIEGKGIEINERTGRTLLSL